MADNTVINEAKKWIDGLSDGTGAHGSWRLETIGKRYRYQFDTQGKRRRVPVRIRRFAKGIPWSLVFEALRYLESQAPYTGFLFNGVKVEAKYRPTLTAWRRDDQEQVDGNAQGSYTLVQDLIEDGFDDAVDSATSSSCSEDVVTQWHWDSASVEDLPAGGQGCTYSIQSLRRNEDGTFDYALVRRTALTRHVPEHVQSSTEFETVYEQSWINAYGEPDRFTDHEGNVLDIPDGKFLRNAALPDLVTRRVVRNEDCTYRVDVERKVSHESRAEITSQQTVFAADKSEETLAQETGLADAPAPSGGVVTTHKTKKRADGLYDNTVATRKELRVDGAATEIRTTPRAVITTTTHRSRSEKLLPPGRDDYGESVRNEKTEGGLWTVTSVVQNPQDGVLLKSDADRTIFNNRTADTYAKKTVKRPLQVSAGDGHTSSKSCVRTDAGGFEVTEVENDELSVPEAVVDSHQRAKGLVVQTTDRNQRAGIGVSVRTPRVAVEKTEGGSRNVTTTKLTARSGPDRISHESDVYSKTTESSRITVSGSVVKSPPTRADGTVVRRISEIDDTGFTTTTTRTTEEVSVKEASVESRVRNRSITTQMVSRNQPTALPASEAGKPGITTASEKTPGGRYNNRLVAVEPRIGVIERRTDQYDAFKTVTEIAQVSPGVHNYSSNPNEFGVAAVITSSVDEDGVVTTSTQLTREKAQSISETTRQGHYVKETTKVYISPSKSTLGGQKPIEGRSITVSNELTSTGFYRVTETVSEVFPYQWELPIVDTGYSYARTVYFRNQKLAGAEGLITSLTEAYAGKLTTWIGEHRGPHSNNIDVNVDFDLNHGTLNGMVKLSASWLPEQPGINGSLDKVFVGFTYKTTSLVSSYIDKAKGFKCYYLHKNWKHVEGRGTEKFKSYLNASKYDASFTFNPRTTVWSVDVCTGIYVNTSENA